MKRHLFAVAGVAAVAAAATSGCQPPSVAARDGNHRVPSRPGTRQRKRRKAQRRGGRR